MQKSKLALFASALIAFSSPSMAKQSYDPSDDLINAFCGQDLGEHTLVALGQSQALEKIITSMQDDENCELVYHNALALHQNLQLMESYYNQKDQTKRRYELEVNRYADELATERATLFDTYMNNFAKENPGYTTADYEAYASSFVPSSDYYEGLESAYLDSKINLISSEASLSTDGTQDEQTHRLNNISVISGNLRSLFAAINDSPNCSQEKLNVLGQLASQVLGTAGSIYGGIVGGVMMLGSLAITGVDHLVKNIKKRNRLELIEDSRLRLALGCAYESMAKTWCQANSTEAIIKHNQILRHSFENPDETDCKSCGNLYLGLDLLTKKIIPHNAWMTRIISGSAPSSSASASVKNTAFNMRYKLEAYKRMIEGDLNQAKVEEEQLSGEALRNFRIQKMKDVIGMTMSGSSEESPYQDLFVEDPSCGQAIYFYSGAVGEPVFAASEPMNGDDMGCHAYAKRLYPQAVSAQAPTVQRLRDLMVELNIRATEHINQKISLVFEENPELVMQQYHSLDPRTGTTPKEFLSSAITYLQKVRDQFLSDESYRYSIINIEKIGNKLSEAYSVLESPCSEKSVSCAIEQISQLGNILAPDQQIFFISNSLQEIVKQDVDYHLQTEQVSDEFIKFIIDTSYQSGSKVMLSKYLDISKARNDAREAKMITEDNLVSLSNIFDKAYLRILKKLKNRGDKRLLGKYCIDALIVPDSSKMMTDKILRHRKKKLMEICRGSVYPSDYPDKVADLEFNKVAKLSFQDRICQMAGFNKKQKLLNYK